MPSEATYSLRQRVLRPHQTLEQVRQEHSADHPGTAAFAALAGDEAVVATVSVHPERCPWQPSRADSWRLRGMATEPAYRGHGLGGAVLDALLTHVAANGGGLVWCNARTPAPSLYARAGFSPHGEEWVDPQIGPHVCMSREVDSTQGA